MKNSEHRKDCTTTHPEWLANLNEFANIAITRAITGKQ
jgi:hypothetical protein